MMQKHVSLILLLELKLVNDSKLLEYLSLYLDREMHDAKVRANRAKGEGGQCEEIAWNHSYLSFLQVKRYLQGLKDV